MEELTTRQRKAAGEIAKNKCDKMEGLSTKQKKFAVEYIKCAGNARLAAENAGYAKSTAENASEWLREGGKKYKKVMHGLIQSVLDEICSADVADATEVMTYLTSVMRGESTAETIVIEGEGDGVSSARRMKKSPDEKERLKAAEILARILGLSNTVNVSGGVPVIITGEGDLAE